MAEKIFQELSDKITMFKNGFEAITNQIDKKLVEVNKEVARLTENTKAIPKIKNENKEMFKQLSSMSGTLGELVRRLDIIEQN